MSEIWNKHLAYQSVFLVVLIPILWKEKKNKKKKKRIEREKET